MNKKKERKQQYQQHLLNERLLSISWSGGRASVSNLVPNLRRLPLIVRTMSPRGEKTVSGSFFKIVQADRSDNKRTRSRPAESLLNGA